VIVWLALLAPGVVLLANNSGALGGALLAVGVLVAVVVAFVYAPALMQRDGNRNGQTLGKQWVGIRVIRVDRQPYGFGSALVREFVVKNLLFGVVGGFFLSIPTLLNVLWPLWDDENRALHDMVVESRVART
jgi:uncharacterized RDD family membrane protein YckC